MIFKNLFFTILILLISNYITSTECICKDYQNDCNECTMDSNCAFCIEFDFCFNKTLSSSICKANSTSNPSTCPYNCSNFDGKCTDCLSSENKNCVWCIDNKKCVANYFPVCDFSTDNPSFCSNVNNKIKPDIINEL
eukprot:TRINITY_DN10981_c0_g1_i1.p1 TRINITY_DN10981_c0_g1~~TRINITY_DN10981_c0_g1_i1.p1  ORF type:complete len:137 (+),score=24.18 TRINITY_DN10981_c0_g1_i1:43-453(+)